MIMCVMIIAVRDSREAEQLQEVGSTAETGVKPHRSHSEVTEN